MIGSICRFIGGLFSKIIYGFIQFFIGMVTPFAKYIIAFVVIAFLLGVLKALISPGDVGSSEPMYILNTNSRVIHQIGDPSINDIDPIFRKALTREQAIELVNRGEGFRFKKD